MVAAKDDWKLTIFGMTRHDASNGLTNPGYESRVLHLADWWVIFLSDCFKLVVSVKLNLPS